MVPESESPAHKKSLRPLDTINWIYWLRCSRTDSERHHLLRSEAFIANLEAHCWIKFHYFHGRNWCVEGLIWFKALRGLYAPLRKGELIQIRGASTTSQQFAICESVLPNSGGSTCIFRTWFMMLVTSRPPDTVPVRSVMKIPDNKRSLPHYTPCPKRLSTDISRAL